MENKEYGFSIVYPVLIFAQVDGFMKRNYRNNPDLPLPVRMVLQKNA
jgi:hypothetical protein